MSNTLFRDRTIPARVWYDENLRPLDKLIITEWLDINRSIESSICRLPQGIATAIHDRPEFYAPYFAALLGVRQRAAEISLERLIKFNYIKEKT